MQLPRLQDASISRKLTLLVVAAVAVALLLSCAADIYNHRQFVHGAMVRQLSALANVLGENTTAALVFDDADTASELLSSLRVQASIESAFVYDPQGKLFASYFAEESTGDVLACPAKVGHVFSEDGHLNVSQRIVHDGEAIGTILLNANLADLRAQIANYVSIVFVIMAISFAAAYAFSFRLQRSISEPILALARTAERISAEEDYSIRVQKINNDELGTLYDQFNRMLEQVERGESELQAAQDELEQRVEQRTHELSKANSELSLEIAERRRAEAELEQVNRDFVDAARRAGMAEIASGVLHNVGNVLNSVNVSANTIANRLKNSKRNQLGRVVDLLQQHPNDLGEFITLDPKGKEIPRFLQMLSNNLQSEDELLIGESSSLSGNIEHIKAIIATQQSYASMSGVVEPVDVNELLEDALRLNSTSFSKHKIRVERQLSDLGTVLIDKQRVLQIVINLIKNAKEALLEQHDQERVLSVITSVEDDKLLVKVEDTGIGITEENLTRVFSHGFTTKHNGHGFGLHSCANAAGEMDGELHVHSAGHLRGARFTLSLPYLPALVHA